MNRYQRGLLLLIVVGLAALSGASCPPRWFEQFQPQPPPRVLSTAPTLEEVIQVVNRNNSQIHSVLSTNAALSGTGFPTLRANLALQRPKRFRLRGDLLASAELDLGSNDELFWAWVKRAQPAAMLYCRHDQFAASRLRQMTPLEPEWFIEALGIAEFDPGLPHQEPRRLPGDKLEIRTIRETPQGPMMKVTVLDAAQAWILEQRLYDSQGRLVASSTTSRHRRDPATGLVMPTLVSINFPPAKVELRLDLGNVQINRLAGNPSEIWSMPNYQGYPVVDLGAPNFQWPPASAPAAGHASILRPALEVGRPGN